MEEQLFHEYNGSLRGIKYLRLDGKVPPSKRQQIVNEFNLRKDVDLLLLTTSIGGQGFNLTSADTVIFVEHDWNPMVDLQAMDRVHRLGQKHPVTVYRIVTRRTIEEKLLGTQRFKLKVASSILDADNKSVRTMRTNQLLQLLNPSAQNSSNNLNTKEGKNKAKTGLHSMLQELGELWEERQYQDYSVESFLESLQNDEKAE
mmetsp:Transcript_15064/g.17048  ORF Transcript_15064/g.17048 Transcript_15064/m.17048 type:complete len:202 (+) Transcript_15064:138-743(+)